MFSCGYVGIIGKTNAGKSSLVNALVGEKVSIVTPKTQTTRQNIIGILTKENTQIIFVDTPGIHKSRNNLDRFMMKSVRQAIAGVNVLVYVIDGTKKLFQQEVDYIKKLAEEDKDLKIIVAISKIDITKKADIMKTLVQLQSVNDFVQAVVPYSSKTYDNLQELLNEISKLLPQSKNKNFVYDEDMYTESSVKFMCAEIIREKALMLLDDELPHGIAIEITKFDETSSKTLTTIEADVICEREGHKAIILGKQGCMIKEIGTQARKDMEDLLQTKVMLKIFVKVDQNWRQNKNCMV